MSSRSAFTRSEGLRAPQEIDRGVLTKPIPHALPIDVAPPLRLNIAGLGERAMRNQGTAALDANLDFSNTGDLLAKGPAERIATARIAHQLTRSLAENDSRKVMLALQEILKRYDLSAVARTTGIRRNTLNKSLGAAANPTLSRILILLNALDIRLVAISSDQNTRFLSQTALSVGSQEKPTREKSPTCRPMSPARSSRTCARISGKSTLSAATRSHAGSLPPCKITILPR